ncbi:MAG: flagellar motor switch protein FliM [Terriglobia bacterium]
MDQTLTQEEINTLLRSAQAAADSEAGTPGARRVAPFVYGRASRISKQQVRDVSQLHEVLAYRLKNRLSAFLQVNLEASLMSVDEVQYSEFIESLPQQAYVASINIPPTKSNALLSLDLAGAFAMVDLMLGGNGKPEAPQRPATEIEEKVIQTMVEMVCDELSSCWRQNVDLGFSFGKAQRQTEIYRLMPPYEKMLFVSLEIRLPDTFSTLALAFPAAVSSLLLRSLAARNSHEQHPMPHSRPKLLERLRGCVFGVEMVLPPTRMRGEDLLALVPGQTILIQHRVIDPAVLNVAGHRMFTAFPVRNGKARGAVIQEKFSLAYPAQRTDE